MDSTSSAKLSALSGLRNDIFMIPKYLSIICSEEIRDYGDDTDCVIYNGAFTPAIFSTIE